MFEDAEVEPVEENKLLELDVEVGRGLLVEVELEAGPTNVILVLPLDEVELKLPGIADEGIDEDEIVVTADDVNELRDDELPVEADT